MARHYFYAIDYKPVETLAECPCCGSHKVRRVPRSAMLRWLDGVLPSKAYHCGECKSQFTVFRSLFGAVNRREAT